jgi:hypothetical protein
MGSCIRPLVNTGHMMPRGGGNCDFCGVPSVRYLYACRNFEWNGVNVFRGDVGRWAACYLCSKLVAGKKWGMLTRRVMREVSKRGAIDADQLKHLGTTLRTLHKGFGQHVVPDKELGVHLPLFRLVAVSEA